MHPLIHDWNRVDAPGPWPEVLLDDETLRDGMQSPSVSTPSIDRKIEILHLIDALGIDTADIGLPGAGRQVADDVERLVGEIARSRLRVRANCAARTKLEDIRPIAEISQRVGVPIECCAFIGSSPVRHYAEGWELDQLLRYTEESVGFAVREGLSVMYVTEDTTRADPDTLRQLYGAAIRAGASGRDAFRTATGVHAAAVIKAFRKHDPDLADAVYSGVPARLVGRGQTIDVGPMSGRSNVVFWLEQHGVPVTDELVDRVFAAPRHRAGC